MHTERHILSFVVSLALITKVSVIVESTEQLLPAVYPKNSPRMLNPLDISLARYNILGLKEDNSERWQGQFRTDSPCNAFLCNLILIQ